MTYFPDCYLQTSGGTAIQPSVKRQKTAEVEDTHDHQQTPGVTVVLTLLLAYRIGRSCHLSSSIAVFAGLDVNATNAHVPVCNMRLPLRPLMLCAIQHLKVAQHHHSIVNMHCVHCR